MEKTDCQKLLEKLEKIEESRQKFEEAWNVAWRDRMDKIIGILERISDAQEKKS